MRDAEFRLAVLLRAMRLVFVFEPCIGQRQLVMLKIKHEPIAALRASQLALLFQAVLAGDFLEASQIGVIGHVQIEHSFIEQALTMLGPHPGSIVKKTRKDLEVLCVQGTFATAGEHEQKRIDHGGPSQD